MRRIGRGLRLGLQLGAGHKLEMSDEARIGPSMRDGLLVVLDFVMRSRFRQEPIAQRGIEFSNHLLEWAGASGFRFGFGLRGRFGNFSNFGLWFPGYSFRRLIRDFNLSNFRLTRSRSRLDFGVNRRELLVIRGLRLQLDECGPG